MKILSAITQEISLHAVAVILRTLWWSLFRGKQSQNLSGCAALLAQPEETALSGQEVLQWLRQQDAAWFRRVVANQQTQFSQWLVDSLNDEATLDLAAGCLDKLMVEVPRKSVYMARYPVTNAQYRRFVEAGGYNNLGWWSALGRSWLQNPPAYRPKPITCPDFWADPSRNLPALPVVGVSWYEAEAYCNWLAAQTKQPYRLPTGAEWQQAAQGGDERVYPWGNEWQAGRCNTRAAGLGQATPVGQFSPQGDSPLGCADMSGNVWEWCLDWYDDQQTYRVLHGGSWYSLEDFARCTYRHWDEPHVSNFNIGFRVVLPVLPPKTVDCAGCFAHPSRKRGFSM